MCCKGPKCLRRRSIRPQFRAPLCPVFSDLQDMDATLPFILPIQAYEPMEYKAE